MNVEFTRFTEGFKEWLSIIGYSKDSVASQPRVIEKYFVFMEACKIKNLYKIKLTDTPNWFETEKRRKSKQTGELLKNSTLNGRIRSLKLFSQFLD